MFEASLTWGPSKPLSELNRLIKLRCRVLYETARDAAIATVINTADSLRAQTRKPKLSGKTKAEIVDSADLIPSWRTVGGVRRKCLRDRNGKHVGRKGARLVYLNRGAPIRNCKTFYVTPVNKRVNPYFAVAESLADVKKYEQGREIKRKRALGGLAKYTLGLAMKELSTRNWMTEVNGTVASVAKRFAFASAQGEGEALSVELRSALDYAVLALKDGRGSIDTAMMKAANKTFGILSRETQKWVSPVDIGPCPFPEIVGKRTSKR